MNKKQKPEKLRKQIDKLLKENDCQIEYKIHFPMYKQLPEEVRLALIVLNNHKVQITGEVKSIKKE